MAFSDDLVRALQARLAELGYYRLRVDGLPGPGTSDAVTRFKAANGLKARDFVGPRTLEALGPDATAWQPPAPQAGEPPWLVEARGLLGVRETPGARDNPVIMKWAEDLDQWYEGDDVPWCGLFVAHCMALGAPDAPQGFNRLGARNWLDYGEDALQGDDPATAELPLGGVAVFWRTHRTRSWNGHVAIVTGQNATHLRVIGGNQGDAVTEAWFPRERLLGVRGPSGWSGPLAPAAATGTVSTREA